MIITATHVGYYLLCHRKLWLFHHQIYMEQTSDTVAEGKLDRLVHEIKKSDKLDHAHVAQVKFYLYLLAKNGLEGCAGLLEYPKLRQTQRVEPLDTADTAEVEGWLADMATILALPRCPPLVKKRYCKTCSYHDFCYAE